MPIVLSNPATAGTVVLRLPDPARVSLDDCVRAEKLAHEWVVMAHHAAAVESFNAWVAEDSGRPLAAISWLLCACAQILEAATGASAAATINDMSHSDRWQSVQTADMSGLDAKLTGIVRLGALATLVADDAVTSKYDAMASGSDAAPRLVLNQALMLFDTLIRTLLAAGAPPWGFATAVAAASESGQDVVSLPLATWAGI